MFCRDTDGNLVQLGAGAYGQVRTHFQLDQLAICNVYT